MVPLAGGAPAAIVLPSEGPGDPPRHPGGCMRATRPSLDLDRSLGNEEELGLLVALA